MIMIKTKPDRLASASAALAFGPMLLALGSPKRGGGIDYSIM